MSETAKKTFHGCFTAVSRRFLF